jgi:hypothetical protein
MIASFVGLLALVLAGYTAYLQRKQAGAQVWPRVEMGRHGYRGTLVAANHGVGPARVKAVRVTVDGKPIRRWDELVKAVGYDGTYFQSQISGRVMPAGQEIDMLEAGKKPEERKMIDLVAQALFSDEAPHRAAILLCYCSVFDDCWLTSLGAIRDREVDVDRELSRCPIPEKDRFQQ